MADSNQFNPQSFAASRPASDGAGQSLEDFSRIGTDLIDALGNRAEAIATEQKARAASEIAGLASMLRDAAQSVDQGNRGAISDYAADMASGIDQFADRLRGSSWRVLAADLEDLARRWPALFMASSAVAGFVLGRILMPPTGTGAAYSGSGGAPGMSAAQPVNRPATTGASGTLSDGGAARGFGLPAGEEAP